MADHIPCALLAIMIISSAAAVIYGMHIKRTTKQRG